MNMKLKNQNGVSLMKVIIIVAVIILGIIIISAITSKPGYELSVEKSEPVAYTNLRYSIAQAAASSGGASTLKSEYIDTLGKLVKSVDSSNQWFSSNSGVFYGGTADTSDYQYTWISNGTYCATFCIKQEGNTYYLCDFKFSADTVKGYTLFVE